ACRPASLPVTGSVAGPPPAVSEVGAATTVDCDADTAAGVTVTAAVCVIAVPLIVAEEIFCSAPVELRVPVATPVPSVVALGCVRVLPVPVAASTTLAPLIKLPLASLAVTVIVEEPLPATIDPGAALTVDWAADTGPGVTVTGAVCVIAVPLAGGDALFAPAPVELSGPVPTPVASVGPLGWAMVLPLPVAASTTVAPVIGLPFA